MLVEPEDVELNLGTDSADEAGHDGAVEAAGRPVWRVEVVLIAEAATSDYLVDYRLFVDVESIVDERDCDRLQFKTVQARSVQVDVLDECCEVVHACKPLVLVLVLLLRGRRSFSHFRLLQR